MVEAGLDSESASPSTSVPTTKRKTRKVKEISEDGLPTGYVSSVDGVIKFRGMLRQFATRLGEAEGNIQFDLIPEGDFLRFAMAEMSKPTIDPEVFRDIVVTFEMQHKKTLVKHLGKVGGGLDGAGGTAVDGAGGRLGGEKIMISLDLSGQKSRVLGRARELLRRIHTLSDAGRSRLGEELLILRDLTRKISHEDLTESEIKFIEALLDNEIQPPVDAVVQTPGGNTGFMGGGGGGGGGMGDFLDQTQNDLEQEFKIKRLRRQIREEDTDTGDNQKSGSETIMVQAMKDNTAILLATMEQGKQDNGGASANDVMVQSMKDNTALLLATLANNKDNGPSSLEMMVKMLELQNNKDDGPSSWEMMTQMMGLLNQQNQRDPELQVQLETIRQEAASARQDTYNTQLGFMNQKVTELQGALQRDPFDDFLHQKERMKAMGMWNDGATSVEEKTITEVTGLGREALNNFSESVNTFSTILAPLVQTYAENLRPQTPPPQQPRLDDTAKLERYKSLLGNVDEAIEATAPQQDPAPLAPPPPPDN
ncbi:hypothetical protein LCGC14_1242470 [marine sediment metagenome]|uniref:Uncharacterized protein n=1 Tax=marine sediment metagenome TaxID=412755 RepID=A0A0F9L5H4_9ZZZZ